MRLDPGRTVRCSDGDYGVLADVVIDPTAKRVTHLVVEPRHEPERATLVPAELAADGDDGDAITLRCTADHVAHLPLVREVSYLRLDEFPVEDPQWDVGIQSVLAMPYFMPVGSDIAMPPVDDPVEMGYDRVPKGEVEIERTSPVRDATGEHLGSVDGFVVDGDGQITHLVLGEGHLFGRREVTIPIGAVAKVETDAVKLSLSKHEVGQLPAVRLHRWKR
jgi:sporulation protein YlmC with PRC-barrel domain